MDIETIISGNMENSNTDFYAMLIAFPTALLILLGFIIPFLIMYKNRQMRHKIEMESVKEKYNQEILKSQLEIQEQTLKNISEEIHDNVGQVLSLVVLNLSAIELTDTVKAATKIESVTKLVEKAVGDLRNLSKALDAENIASLGLTTIIRYEMDLIEKTGVYRTTFHLHGEERKLNGEKEIILYRIIQESLNNIIKHAKASSIKIDLSYSESQLSIKILDDGNGFGNIDVNKEDVFQNGAGIKNMKRRANLIGGTFDIKSVPSNGTMVTLSIPYN